jgi:hypothetical protein
VSGLQEDLAVAINTHGLALNANDGTTLITGIGVDTTTAFTSIGSQGSGVSAAVSSGTQSSTHTSSSYGYHIWTALETTNGSTALTIYGSLAGPPARNVNGLAFWFPM